MKRILASILAVLSFTSQLPAQVSVSIPGTVRSAGLLRPGLNIGGNSEYGMMQMLKRLNQMNFGYLPPPIYRLSYPCSTGGTQTTTNYFSANFGTNGFPAGFWTNGSYAALSQTGIVPISGTITGSTDNTASPGINFTLGTALGAACTTGSNTANTDELITRQDNVPFGTLTPQSYGGAGFFNTSSSFSSDVSGASTNTYQSLDLPTAQTQTFYIDAVFHTWAPDPSISNVTWLNVNGSYTLTYKARGVGTCSMAYSAGRIGSSPFVSGSDTLTSSWQTFNHTFTGSETGAQTQNIAFAFTPTCTGGDAHLQDMDIIEGSTLAGNTTPFRDAVVRAFQQLNPGSLRLMTPASWPSSIPCQTAAIGMQCAAGLNGTNKNSLNNSIGYDDFLQLCYFLKATPWITVGHFNTPADVTTLVNWEASSGWTAKFKALGIDIFTEIANEPWNPGAQGNLDTGNGLGYGSMFGPIATAFRAASGYDSAVNRIIASNWFSGSQSYFLGTGGGWAKNVLSASGCTGGPPTQSAITPLQSQCPDMMDIAPYSLSYIANLTNLQQDENSEVQNFSSAPCAYTGACSATSEVATAASLLAQHGILTGEYEHSYSPDQCASALGITQAQMNQASNDVSMGHDTTQAFLLAERDAGVTGPRNGFAFVDQPYSGACGVEQTSWTWMAQMAAGPGQLSTFGEGYRAAGIAFSVMNQAIGNNSSLMDQTVTGTPTLNYAGGQNDGTKNTIIANASVNLVNTFVRGDGAGHYTVIAYNSDSVSHTVTFSGAGAPTGTVVKNVYASGNALTDTNIDSLSQNYPAAVIPFPTPTTFTGSTDTLAPGTFTTYTYSTAASGTSNTLSGIKLFGGTAP